MERPLLEKVREALTEACKPDPRPDIRLEVVEPDRITGLVLSTIFRLSERFGGSTAASPRPGARGVAGEGLSQEELAIDDLLVDAEVPLEAADREVLKKIAHDLPKKLAKKLAIDWRKTQRGRAAVRTTIKDVPEELPEAYDPAAYERVVAAVYEHVYESYWGEGKSKYSEAGVD